MIIEKELIQSAKEKLGDGNAEFMAEILELEDYDEKNMKAKCPYHDEDTASFIYDKKHYRFHCFGCQKRVDVIDTLMEKRNLTYLDATKELFERAGISYSFGEQGVKTKSQYRYPVEVPLNDRHNVIEYWGKRGISKAVLDYLDVREDKNGNGVFNYYDLNDVLTMVKYRPARTIIKSSGDIKNWCQKDADTLPILFNMNRINTSDPLLICEGETDCMSAIEAGYLNTVSVPLGAGNTHWIEECWDWLNQFESIIIWADNDEAGNKMKTDCLYRLGTWRTKYIETPNYYVNENGKRVPLKDINDCLQIGGKQLVMNLISSAKDVPISSVVDYADIDELDMSEMEGVVTGIKPLDDALNKLYYGTLTVLSGRPGCVDSETEFFNGEKWKKISEYEDGDMVLQYNADGTASLVYPEQYHKYECDSFWELNSSNGINQMVSDEHNMVYITPDGVLAKKNIMDFINSMDSARFLTTFNYSGKGIDLSDDEIRVMCMSIICGVILDFDGDKTFAVRTKDPAVKARAKMLLENARIPYDKINEKTSYVDYVYGISFWHVRGDRFDSYWYQCSSHQLEVVIDECEFWCGYSHNGVTTYSSFIRSTADFIQFALSSTGHRSHISSHNFLGVPVYTVSKEKTKTPSFNKNAINRVFTGDGYKYCFTVPSGMLVLRRGGDINITGNSGKTSIIDQTIAKTIDDGKSVFLFSKEMPERYSANWFNTIVCGRRNMEKRFTKDGKEYYAVPKSVSKKAQEFYREKLFIYKDSEPNDVESVMKSAEECVRKYAVKLVVLDNLMMLDLKCSETEKNTAQTDLINSLIKFASKFNVAVVLIAHPRKTQDSSSDIEMYDIAGTSNIINLAMRSIGLRRTSKKEKEDPRTKWGKYDVVLTIIKDRIFGRADDQMGLWYDNVSRRFYSRYEEYDAKFAWDKNEYKTRLPYVDRGVIEEFPDK